MKYTKKCSKCGKDRPFDMFYKNSGAVDGLTSLCKICIDKNYIRFLVDELRRE